VARICPHLALLLAIAAVGATAAPARADHGGGRSEVRVTSRCTGASTLRLRLRAEDGWIRIDAEIEPVRAGSRWSVIVLHERRIVARVTLATRQAGSVELRRSVRDWFGSDTIVVRASAVGGGTCRAAAAV
jgi:hypothetical protein